MTLALDLQSQIILLHISGEGAYAISRSLRIHYRTAKRYCDAVDLIIEEIKDKLAYGIFEEIKKNPLNFVEKCNASMCNKEENNAKGST
jgi:hypothetical protein